LFFLFYFLWWCSTWHMHILTSLKWQMNLPWEAFVTLQTLLC